MATQKDNTKERKPLPKEIGSKSYNRSVLDKDYSLFSLATDLQFPYSIKTYEAMASDTTLASALNAVQTVALRVPRFIEPYNETTTHINRAKFIDECLGITIDNNDMTHSFDEFLREALTMNKYGFSVHEKVFRVRRKKTGNTVLWLKVIGSPKHSLPDVFSISHRNILLQVYRVDINGLSLLFHAKT